MKQSRQGCGGGRGQPYLNLKLRPSAASHSSKFSLGPRLDFRPQVIIKCKALCENTHRLATKNLHRLLDGEGRSRRRSAKKALWCRILYLVGVLISPRPKIGEFLQLVWAPIYKCTRIPEFAYHTSADDPTNLCWAIGMSLEPVNYLPRRREDVDFLLVPAAG